MSLHHRFAALCMAATMALLSACGGGGGGGGAADAPAPEPAARVASPIAFDPPLLSATVPENGQSAQGRQWLPVEATVPDVSGPVFVLLLVEQQILENEPVEITQVGADRYRALLPLRVSLPAGKYTGNIIVKICLDPACASEAPGSGTPLPYEITVTPGIRLTVSVDGVVVTSRPVQVRSGAVVTVESSVPVGWREGLGGVASFVDTNTSSTWRSTLQYGTTPPGTAFMTLWADTLDTPQAEASIELEVAP